MIFMRCSADHKNSVVDPDSCTHVSPLHWFVKEAWCFGHKPSSRRDVLLFCNSQNTVIDFFLWNCIFFPSSQKRLRKWSQSCLLHIVWSSVFTGRITFTGCRLVLKKSLNVPKKSLNSLIYCGLNHHKHFIYQWVKWVKSSSSQHLDPDTVVTFWLHSSVGKMWIKLTHANNHIPT